MKITYDMRNVADNIDDLTFTEIQSLGQHLADGLDTEITWVEFSEALLDWSSDTLTRYAAQKKEEAEQDD